MKLPDAPFYGWIGPDGRVYECEADDHVDLAYNICDVNGLALSVIVGEDGLSYQEPPDDRLTRLGWLKLDDDGSAWNFEKGYEITAAQMATMLELADAYEQMREEAHRTIKRYVIA